MTSAEATRSEVAELDSALVAAALVLRAALARRHAFFLAATADGGRDGDGPWSQLLPHSACARHAPERTLRLSPFRNEFPISWSMSGIRPPAAPADCTNGAIVHWLMRFACNGRH